MRCIKKFKKKINHSMNYEKSLACHHAATNYSPFVIGYSYIIIKTTCSFHEKLCLHDHLSDGLASISPTIHVTYAYVFLY